MWLDGFYITKTMVCIAQNCFAGVKFRFVVLDASRYIHPAAGLIEEGNFGRCDERYRSLLHTHTQNRTETTASIRPRSWILP
jgi:hypothetical protein